MFGYAAFAQVPYASLPISANANFFETITENINIADSNTQINVFNQLVFEGIVVDDLNSQGSIYIQTLNENVGIGSINSEVFDALQSITEPIDAIESQQAIAAQFAQSKAENVNVDDSSVQYFAALEDRIEDAILDDLSTQTSEFYLALNENSFINSVENINAQFNVNRLEPILNVDNQQSIIAGFAQSVAENIDIVDVEIIGNAFLFSIAEPINVASEQTISSQFIVVNVENIQLNDSSTQQSTFLEAIVEAVTILDKLCYNGWFKIDDSQTADWGPINEAQTPVWTDIVDSQTPDWNAISGPGSASWADINDNQTPDWGTIDTKQPCS